MPKMLPLSKPMPELPRQSSRIEYPLYWRVRLIRPEWFGRRCRIVIHGGKGNRLIEFDNGERVVCPGAYLRRHHD